MMQRYNVFSLIPTFFVFFFSKACDKDTNLRQMGGKAETLLCTFVCSEDGGYKVITPDT